MIPFFIGVWVEQNRGRPVMAGVLPIPTIGVVVATIAAGVGVAAGVGGSLG